MTLPKFIITMDGYFRLGMVNQHKHLLKPGDQCIGGGYYHFDFVSNRILLDRESYDFGRPKDDDAISNLCCQFPISADYDGLGAKGTKIVFPLPNKS